MSDASALNVYCRSEEHQNRLLTEILGPVLEESVVSGRLESFFFDRFDGRGPHVYVMLAAAGEREGEALRAELAEKLAPFLAQLPVPEAPNEAEILERHHACRGKALCTLDRLPGLAEPNTFAFADHPPSEYPFDIWSGLVHQADFRRAFSEQSLWSIARIAAGGGRKAMGPSLRFLATLDSTLRRLGLDAEAYWRYHTGTLLPESADQIAEAPAATAASFARLVTEANLAAFERVFAAVGEDAAAEDPRARRLAEYLAPELAEGKRGRRALREVIHLSLKQLGIHLGYQIPMVVYSWRRCFGSPQGSPAGLRASL